MKAIIQYEWLQIKRNKVSILLLAITCSLLIVSLVTSWSYYQWYSRLQQEVSGNARGHWETQGEKNSHSAAHFGIYLFKPLSALAIWDNGIEKHHGVSLYIEAHTRNQLQLKAIEDNPLLARWGELTPAAMLLFVLPLLLVWLAANTVVNDRANGTLKMLLMQGVTARKLVWGKALALWCISGVMISAIWLGGGVLAGILSKQSFFSVSSFFLLLLYLLYAGVFIQAGIIVSLKSKSVRGAMVSALSIWLLVVWLTPRFFVQWSDAKYPPVHAEAFTAKIREDIAHNGLNSHGAAGSKEKELEKKWLQRYGADSVQQLPLNWLGVVLQADEEINNPIYDKHYDSLHSIFRRQINMHRWSGWLSPTLPAKYASMAFAGTDLFNCIDFYEQTEVYRKIFIKRLNERLRDNSRYGGRDTGTTGFWKTAPVFTYTPPGDRYKWTAAKAPFLTVAIWVLLLAAVTQVLAGRIKTIEN